ncbi:uncharacterized protein LOC119072134 [Bradysia coprophila]|uniref:uncharacterized protein LOC119072134 n=1 Tax=Bradysia coprophila TaxID=38358 RepID=UPI00187D7E2B|nr:uncharacterized protein LOC119072134 [Bradysia coprophila]
MNWCLKNGSSGTKEKLVALLSNINSVIGDEMFTYKHNINDEAVKNFEQDAALIELETAHFPGGQEVFDEEEGDFLSGNRLILSADIDVHLSDANVLADQHVAGEVVRLFLLSNYKVVNSITQLFLQLVSMDKQKTDSIESKIDNSQVADEEVSTEAYEFDDIIDYDPVSDDDEAIDEGGHEIQIDENEETYDALDRIFKSTGLNSSRIEANVLFDGTLQVEEVTGGSICEPPQQNFKCGSCDKTEMHVDTSDGSENKKELLSVLL